MSDAENPEINSDNPVTPLTTDPLAALKTALRYGVIGLVALTVIGLAVWVPISGMAGLWGVLIGAGVGGGFILVTVVVVLATAQSSPTVAMAVLMGSWLVKMIAAIVVMASIKNLEFYSKGALVSMIIGAIVVVLGAEMWGVLKTRAPYVDTPAND